MFISAKTKIWQVVVCVCVCVYGHGKVVNLNQLSQLPTIKAWGKKEIGCASPQELLSCLAQLANLPLTRGNQLLSDFPHTRPPLPKQLPVTSANPPLSPSKGGKDRQTAS